MRVLIGLSLFLFLATELQAKEVVEISEEKNEKLALEVQKEVKKQVKKYVTPLFLAKKLKMPFPPVKPRKGYHPFHADWVTHGFLPFPLLTLGG